MQKQMETETYQERIKELEKQLSASQSRYNEYVEKSNKNFKELFDNSNDLIITFVPTGSIKFANLALKSRLGYTDGELQGLRFVMLLHPDYRKEGLQNILKITAGSELERFETVLISKTGKNIYVTGKLTAVYEGDEVVEFNCVFYDITERIRAESAQSLYYQIANITITQKDLEQLYSNIFSQLNQMLKVVNFSIFFKRGKEFEKAFRINENEKEDKLSLDVETQLMRYTLERERSLIVYREGINKIFNQKRTVPEDPIPEIWVGVTFQSSYGMGIMSVSSYSDQSAFNNKDLELLDYIAGQINIALERQNKEEQIVNQSATLSAIFDSSTHEIWSVDRSYRFTSFNQNYEVAFERYFGVVPQVGKSIIELESKFITQKNRDFWIEKYKESFKGRFINFQNNVVDSKGRKVWRDVFVNPIFLPNGRIEELSIIANDITEKKQSESALIASELKFRNIFESFQDIYFRCNSNGVITMVSPSLQEVLGFRQEEVLHKNVSSFIANKDLLTPIFLRLFREKKIQNVEGTLVTKGEETLQFLFNIRLIEKEDGNQEIEGVARDVTQLKETNEELKRAKDMAERSLKIKERFLANMSHEIRTPMNGIIGMIDLMASTRLDDEQEDYVKTIHKSSQTLLNILNDILDLSKIEAGKMELRKDPVQLSKTIEKVYGLFSQQASQQENSLFYHIDPKIPKWVLIDETRLTQVLSNLTSNAIKFNNSKGHINISLRMVEREGKDMTFKVSIKDSGIGISEEDQKNLFQSFHQVDNSQSKNFGGTGLGLAISKELVKSMQGDIGVVSTPGLGSTFWFTFRAEEIEISDEKTLKIDPPVIKQFTDQEPKILLVDDNDVNRKVARSILKKSGCNVIEATDGFEAIKLFKNGDYDLIFMDIQMPRMDGIETVRHIRAIEDKAIPPIVAITAYSMEEDREKFLSGGLDDYLAKPIKASLLVEKVRKWLKFEPKSVGSESLEVKSNQLLIINQNTLNQLAKYGGAELIESSLLEFEKESKEMIDQMDGWLSSDDFESIRRELHTMKGNAGTLGMERLATQAAAMEKKIKENNFEGLHKELSLLKNRFAEFQENFQNLMVTDE